MVEERDFELVPGAFVRSNDAPEWGLGQVQSYIGHRVTVNFEHQGKLLLDASRVSLTIVEPDIDMDDA